MIWLYDEKIDPSTLKTLEPARNPHVLRFCISFSKMRRYLSDPLLVAGLFVAFPF